MINNSYVKSICFIDGLSYMDGLYIISVKSVCFIAMMVKNLNLWAIFHSNLLNSQFLCLVVTRSFSPLRHLFRFRTARRKRKTPFSWTPRKRYRPGRWFGTWLLWLSIYWFSWEESSSQLTNSYFSDGWRKTTNQRRLTDRTLGHGFGCLGRNKTVHFSWVNLP